MPSGTTKVEVPTERQPPAGETARVLPPKGGRCDASASLEMQCRETPNTPAKGGADLPKGNSYLRATAAPFIPTGTYTQALQLLPRLSPPPRKQPLKHLSTQVPHSPQQSLMQPSTQLLLDEKRWMWPSQRRLSDEGWHVDASRANNWKQSNCMLFGTRGSVSSFTPLNKWSVTV